MQLISLAVFCGGVFWLVSLYANGLRDARYLDGWMLAGGMGLQLGFHMAIKTAALTPKSAVRWRQMHVFIGYVLIAGFVSHSDFSLPDSAFEWALWLCFVLVTLSGVFGTYLAWSRGAKHSAGERMGSEALAARRAAIAREVHAIVSAHETDAPLLPLPVPPHDAWILELYTNHLKFYFAGPQNFASHAAGSQLPFKRLTNEIDNLARYVDKPAQEKLDAIKILASEKDRLDFAHVQQALTKAWLFVHVPVTYSLIVLTILHVLSVYAFSSGDW